MASAGAGLTERERDGCRELLELLHTDDLLALTDTVTNRLVHPDNRQEAIHAILLYSQSAEELLKRKKVFREIIFKYLAAKGVIVPPSSEKHQLVDRAKQYWCEQLKDYAPEQKFAKPDVQKSEEGGKQGGDKQDDDKGCHSLGEEFCQWFFGILNSQNPLVGEPHEEWGPQHFWDDVILKFCYNTSEQNIEEYFGAELDLEAEKKLQDFPHWQRGRQPVSIGSAARDVTTRRGCEADLLSLYSATLEGKEKTAAFTLGPSQREREREILAQCLSRI
ncbi:uncharacterized protein C3orf38 homolog isoform X2 [Rhineura floridana]|uniref:uncharacterized protein C3orf38 homolog isoform X2 n=1 Tax=Rhineura floridana TaxID=261503 RepID=UPI002AC7E825|nr:uncharacterized protein C3orf38 homolog isoform X2 [Rhineura floridana]